MDLVGNMVMVEEGMEKEGTLKMAEDEGNLKEPEGKQRLREEGRQMAEEDKPMAEEDKPKLVGMLIAAESMVLVGIEMVQSMVLMNMEMEKALLSSEVLEVHTVLMAQTRNHASLLLRNAV